MKGVHYLFFLYYLPDFHVPGPFSGNSLDCKRVQGHQTCCGHPDSGRGDPDDPGLGRGSVPRLKPPDVAPDLQEGLLRRVLRVRRIAEEHIAITQDVRPVPVIPVGQRRFRRKIISAVIVLPVRRPFFTTHHHCHE